MSEETERFIANGGAYERLPVGAMAETGWKSADYAPNSQAMRERSFAKMEAAKRERGKVEAAERAARKAREPVVPAPASPKRRTVRAKPSGQTRAQRGPWPKIPNPGPMFAAPGSAKRKVFDRMGTDWATVASLSQATGIRPKHVREYLRLMAARGWVESAGEGKARLWRRAAGEAPALPKATAGGRTGIAVEVLAAIRAGCSTLGQVLDRVGGNPRTVSIAMNRLKKDGQVECSGHARMARWSPVDAADR